MWEKIAVIWKIPELRSKIGLTLLMLAIYRVGFQIEVPILDHAKVHAASSQRGGVGVVVDVADRHWRLPFGSVLDLGPLRLAREGTTLTASAREGESVTACSSRHPTTRRSRRR